MTKTKISLANLQGKLSRTEMKNVLGGVDTMDSNAGLDDSGGGCYKCCPKNSCGSPLCSTGVNVPDGSHADCSANGSDSQVCKC